MEKNGKITLCSCNFCIIVLLFACFTDHTLGSNHIFINPAIFLWYIRVNGDPLHGGICWDVTSVQRPKALHRAELMWHLVYIGFGGLIDGYSALCVVYEVPLEVVMTTRAWCAGDAGIAIWRARLSAGQLDSGRLIKADVKAILGWKHMHSWIELSLYICITQRETYRILMIMLNMRQMDLSSGYM